MPGKYSTETDPAWQKPENSKQILLNIAGWTFIFCLFLLIVVGRQKLQPWLNKWKQRIDKRWNKPGIYDLHPVKGFSSKQQFNIFYIVCGGLIVVALITKFYPLIIPPALLLGVIFLAKLFPVEKYQEHSAEYLEAVTTSNPRYLVYHGSEFDFTKEELEKMLFKYLSYYETLDIAQREIFLERLRKFISRKNFVIHDTSGFKEMPVLISASAIQLSFGLSKYLLPVFNEIHIYPDEFISSHQSLRIVIGNVSDNHINISWKHFLNGFQYPDGVNVGLHEMAHAYYYQNFATQYDLDENFLQGYKAFESRSKTALLYELSSLSSLYTLYGLSNEQEFWAESIELFFEKPVQLKLLDASLFNIIGTTLNQGMTK